MDEMTDLMEKLRPIARDAALGAAVREAVGEVDAAKLRILQDAISFLWANEFELGHAVFNAIAGQLEKEESDGSL